MSRQQTDNRTTETGVDLDLLNKRLSCRFIFDFEGDRQIPGAEDHAVKSRSEWLETFLNNSDQDWATGKWSKVGYDALHFIRNFATMLNVDKHSPVAKLFNSLVSDAIFKIIPGERARVYDHLRKLGVTEPETRRFKRSYWRKMALYEAYVYELIWTWIPSQRW